MSADLTPARIRLVNRFKATLRDGRAPTAADYLAFGGLAQMTALNRALRHLAPEWLPELQTALQHLRAERWRLSRASTPRGRTGVAPVLSVLWPDVSPAWRMPVEARLASRTEIDAGQLVLDLETPPSAKVLKSLRNTVRQLSGTARDAGLAQTFDTPLLGRFLANMDARESRNATFESRLKELILFGAWIGAPAEVLDALRAERRRRSRMAVRQRKTKEAWLIANPITIAEIWSKAEALLVEGQGLAPGGARRHRLRHAAALALAVVCPLRIGDLHRIEWGTHLTRSQGLWSLRIRTAKTGALYETGPLWPELTPFLDALLLEGRDPMQIDARLTARAGRPVFSRNDATQMSVNWISTVWRTHVGCGEHIIRTLWHEVAADDGKTSMALAICGQTDPRTAQHYTLKTARKEAGLRGRALLVRARASRLGRVDE